MGSMDRLPFDILPLIFRYLAGSDLLALALVNRFFSSGALPQMYESIVVNLALTKRLDNIVSPFKSILLHRELAVYVKTCVIAALPYRKSVPNPKFIIEFASAFQLLKNLESFHYTCAETTGHLSTCLASLKNLTKLSDMRIHAHHVSPIQAKAIGEVVGSEGRGLTTIKLDQPSCAVLQILEPWVQRNSGNLTSLSLHKANDMNIGVLTSIFKHVPRLKKLSVIECLGLHHLEIIPLLTMVPRLENLSFTVWTNSGSIPPDHRPTDIKHLLIDNRISHPNLGFNLKSTWLGLLQVFSLSRLESLTLQGLDPILFPPEMVMKQILYNHGATLRRFNLVRVIVSSRLLGELCEGCLCLEQLVVAIPRELNHFTGALAKSKTLETLVDAMEMVKSHHQHQIDPARLSSTEVKQMFTEVKTLRRLINSNRCWIRTESEPGEMAVQAFRVNQMSSPLTRKL